MQAAGPTARYLVGPNLSVDTEPLTDELWDDLLPLTAAHNVEVGPFPDLVFNPNKAAYQRMFAHGALAVITARKGEALVGYAAFFVSPSLHYFPAIFAQADVLYVDPAHRDGMLGLSLMRHAHWVLREHFHADRVFLGSKADASKSIMPLLDRLGYEVVDTVAVKKLEAKWLTLA